MHIMSDPVYLFADVILRFSLEYKHSPIEYTVVLLTYIYLNFFAKFKPSLQASASMQVAYHLADPPLKQPWWSHRTAPVAPLPSE